MLQDGWFLDTMELGATSVKNVVSALVVKAKSSSTFSVLGAVLATSLETAFEKRNVSPAGINTLGGMTTAFSSIVTFIIVVTTSAVGLLGEALVFRVLVVEGTFLGSVSW